MAKGNAIVLLTSAMGNQGRLLIPRLARAGFRVRAFDIAADAALLKSLGASEVVRGDLLDEAALGAAMHNVDTVYHLGPNAHPREDEIGFTAIRAARSAEVAHFVFSSVLHPQIAALTQHRMKLRVSEALLESGLAWTIIEPAHYMQTLQHRASFAGEPFRLTWSLERRQALVDLADVADVAVRIVAEGAHRHAGATYELCSGECLTAWDIAARLSTLLGREVAAVRVMPEEVIESVFGPDTDRERFAERVRLFTRVADWYSAHDFDGADTVLRHLLGRAPNSLADFLARDFADWSRVAQPKSDCATSL